MYICKILNNSLRNCTGIQRWKNVRRFTQSSSEEQTSPLQYKRETKEISSSIQKKNEKKHSFPPLLPSEEKKLQLVKLNEDITMAGNLESLLNIYLQEKSSFNHYQYLLTIQSLAELFQNGIISSELQENAIFQSICYDVWKITRQMDTFIVLNFYRSFLTLGVSTNYLLMQALLQMMRHQINDFQLKELIFLNTLLKETEPCNLKYALQQAVPIAIENKINVYLPPTLKPGQCTELLEICIRGRIKGLKKVLELLYDQTLPNLFTYKDLHTFSLKIIDLLSKLLDLLQNKDKKHPIFRMNIIRSRILAINCLDGLASANLNTISEELILNVLDSLGKVYNTGKNDFAANEDFLSNVAQKCIAERWDFTSVCKVVDYQLKLRYMNDQLLSLAVYNLPEASSVPSDQISVHSLVSALAASDIPAPENKKIVHHLLNLFTLQTENLDVSWFKVALDLLSLNYFPENLLKTILHEDYFRRYFDHRPGRQEYAALFKLNSALIALGWNNRFELDKEWLHSSFQKYIESRPSASLRPALATILGSECCVLTNVITPQKNDLDHLIVLDDGGRPIPLDFSDLGFESIELGDLSQFSGKRKVGLVEVPDNWIYRPGEKLEGRYKLELKLLEKEGFEVILLHEQEMRAQESEQGYLKEKLQDQGFVI